MLPADRRRLSVHLEGEGQQTAPASQNDTFVTAATCERWGRKASPTKGTKRGRPPKAGVIEGLVVKLATENDWGCTRIIAELRKLGLEGCMSGRPSGRSCSSTASIPTLGADQGRGPTSSMSEG